MSPSYSDDSSKTPFEMIGEGKYECEHPNFYKKQCEAISIYQKIDENNYKLNEKVSIESNVFGYPKDAKMVFDAELLIMVIDGRLCSRFSSYKINKVYFNGRIISGRKVINKIKNSIPKKYNEALMCAEYQKTLDGYRRIAYIDSIREPDLDENVIWIEKSDSYQVATGD
jgi:hypothetical protein